MLSYLYPQVVKIILHTGVVAIVGLCCILKRFYPCCQSEEFDFGPALDRHINLSADLSQVDAKVTVLHLDYTTVVLTCYQHPKRPKQHLARGNARREMLGKVGKITVEKFFQLVSCRTHMKMAPEPSNELKTGAHVPKYRSILVKFE